MKKLLILLMAMLTLLSLVACGDDEGDGGDGGHTHNYVQHIEQVPATCTTESYHRYMCECGEENHVTVSPALGHIFNTNAWVLEKEPTLTEEGLVHNECVRCYEKVEHVFPKLNATDYDYMAAGELTCSSNASEAADRYYVLYEGNPYVFSVSVEIPEHDYQPDSNNTYYIEHCTVCGKTKEGTERLHEYVLDDYKATCSICGYVSTRTVYKATATKGTNIIGTYTMSSKSDITELDEPVTELYVFDGTYVIFGAPEGEYYDGVRLWNYTNKNGSFDYTNQAPTTLTYSIQLLDGDYSVYADMYKKQAMISVQWSNGLKDSEGNSVSSVKYENSTSYYNVNLGDTYTLVPGENTATSVFLGWRRGVDDVSSVDGFGELFTNSEIVITNGTTDNVITENKFRVSTSRLTSILPNSWDNDYILVSGYLYDTETLTVTKYDTPTKLSVNSQGRLDIHFVSYYHNENSLYVKNVNSEGKILARGLYYNSYGALDSLKDSTGNKVNYTVSPDNVTVDGAEYCEFKFINVSGVQTNPYLYWGKNAAWMYQGSTFVQAQFYKAASPEDYLDVSDMSVSILETSLRKLSTITVSLNSLPTEEELVAYYKAFITEYQDAGENIYTYKSCGDNKLTTESDINSQAQSLYSNSNTKIYMYLTTSYSCELSFSLDTDNSQLIITLEMVYT